MNPAVPVLLLVALAQGLGLAWLFLSAAFLLWGARLAGVERRSFGRALSTFLLGGLAMGQVLEPLLFGKRTGLSPLSVVLAASFWAFLWGPIGLLISTPVRLKPLGG